MTCVLVGTQVGGSRRKDGERLNYYTKLTLYLHNARIYMCGH